MDVMEKINKLNKKKQLAVLQMNIPILDMISKSKGKLARVLVAAAQFDIELDCDKWTARDPKDIKTFLNKSRKAVGLPDKQYTDIEAAQKIKDIIPHIVQFHGGNQERTQMIMGGQSSMLSDEVLKQLTEELT